MWSNLLKFINSSFIVIFGIMFRKYFPTIYKYHVFIILKNTISTFTLNSLPVYTPGGGTLYFFIICSSSCPKMWEIIRFIEKKQNSRKFPYTPY